MNTCHYLLISIDMDILNRADEISDLTIIHRVLDMLVLVIEHESSLTSAYRWKRCFCVSTKAS